MPWGTGTPAGCDKRDSKTDAGDAGICFSSGKAGTRVWISELERTVQVAITDLKMKEG